jgi:hypothetical protein
MFMRYTGGGIGHATTSQVKMGGDDNAMDVEDEDAFMAGVDSDQGRSDTEEEQGLAGGEHSPLDELGRETAGGHVRVERLVMDGSNEDEADGEDELELEADEDEVALADSLSESDSESESESEVELEDSMEDEDGDHAVWSVPAGGSEIEANGDLGPEDGEGAYIQVDTGYSAL